MNIQKEQRAIKKIIRDAIGNMLPQHLKVRIAERIVEYLHSEGIKILCKSKPTTNYEKVKQMSVEEMASIMMCPYDGKDGFNAIDCIDTGKCMDCCIKWLKSEVDDVEKN